MKELLEFLNEHSVVEIILFRTQYVASCTVVYIEDNKFLYHYFSVEDIEEATLSLSEHYKLVSLLEEIKFIPVGSDVIHV